MGVKMGGKVEKVNGKEVSYAQFVENYMDKNQPVILTGLMDDWRACKDWVSADGKPNLRFFSDHFGASRVQVADCVTREFTDQKRVEMSVSEFIEHWIDSSNSDDGKPLLYLKDWHFVKEYPDYVAYSTPVFFLDDWLNLYLDKYHMHDDPESYQERSDVNCSDYRFVYMGAKGTWTPLHADVFRSYSWSANVCGRKQWYFLCPIQHHLVFDRYMKSAVYNIFEDVCKLKYPGFEEAIWWECTQEQNEIIFVPSGWYHQVHNLEDTISINHNWFNAYNISWVVRISYISDVDEKLENIGINLALLMIYFLCKWDLLLREYHEAAGYIEDLKDICDDFEGLCQRNIAANAGMDFRDFFIFMIRFALANFVLLYQLTRSKGFINGSSSKMAQLLLINLKNIKCITLKMKSEAAWQNHGIAAIDLVQTIKDESFMEFCNTLGKTYSMMCNLSEINSNQSQPLLEHEQISVLYPFGSHICNPDNLITFLDHALELVE